MRKAPTENCVRPIPPFLNMTLFLLPRVIIMAAKWEFVRNTKASPTKVLEYLSHPENYPKNHPGFVRKVSVDKNENDTITYEQEIEMMRRNMSQQQRMTIMRDQNKVRIDTLDGSGKGSVILMTISPNSDGGSQVKYLAEMELGPLGFMAKGAAKTEMERVANEDQSNLDALA